MPDGSTPAPLQWVSVQSTNLAACAYDDQTGLCYVRFAGAKGKPGAVWAYHVAKAVYATLLAAPSKGKFFLAKIKPIGGQRISA